MRLIVRTFAKTLATAAVLLVVAVPALAQQRGLRVRPPRGEFAVISGQIVDLMIEGVPDKLGTSLPLDRFQVLIGQDGNSYNAQVRSAIPSMALPEQYDPKTRMEDLAALQAQMKPVCRLSVTIPQGLVPGPARLTVVYEGRKRSDDVSFRVLEVPPTPKIFIALVGLSSSPSGASPEMMKKLSQDIIVHPSRDLYLHVLPLLDTSAPDTAIAVTFRQGQSSRDVRATVAQDEPVRVEKDGFTLAPALDRLRVRAPDGLVEGPVEIEVQFKVHGKVSDSALIDAIVRSPENAEAAARPHILSLEFPRVGRGQSFAIVVQTEAETNPDSLQVVLEKSGRLKTIKPERTASPGIFQGRQSILLKVRAPADFIGKVNVRVTARLGDSEISSGENVELDITDEIQPPIIRRVLETTKQDIRMMATMREQAERGGLKHFYDPAQRYVTIEALGFEYDTRHVRVRFTQQGRSYTLSSLEDIPLSLGDRVIVRLPDEITIGQAQVSFENIALGQYSVPATGLVEITQPPQRRPNRD